MTNCVRLAEAVAARINSFEIPGVAAEVALRPKFDAENDVGLKVSVVPLGSSVERTGRQTFKATRSVGVGFQEYLGTPLNATRFRELVEIVESIQTAFGAEVLRVVADDATDDYFVASVDSDMLYDDEHLENASVFTSVLTITANADFTVEE